MNDVIISVENLSKKCRLSEIGKRRTYHGGTEMRRQEGHGDDTTEAVVSNVALRERRKRGGDSRETFL